MQLAAAEPGALTHPAAKGASRAPKVAVLLALCCGAATAAQSIARADQEAEAAEAQSNHATLMKRYIVSATRIDKNPWRYASVPGFEVLTRASDEKTSWELNSMRRGLYLENKLLPQDWHPQSAVPYTIIIDDTDMDAVPAGQLHSQPIQFHSPVDALTWGDLSESANFSSDPIGSSDEDTYALNANLYGVDATNPACGSISLNRVFRCAPPLPKWLISGLLGTDCGIFRESFVPMVESAQAGFPIPVIRGEAGPGTLWVSLDETQQLLKKIRKNKKAKIEIPSLKVLFAESLPSREDVLKWESEAGLFTRWGLLGPGQKDPAMSRSFLELVRRARREPVTEQVFTECFGFGIAAMDEKLGVFLKSVLARPTSLDLEMPAAFPEPDLKEATADQIGRILGDWLRMQGDSLRGSDMDLSEAFLFSAGRMLERAYREDNGLPPDVDPAHGGEQSANASKNASYGSAVVMKPFIVSATHLHDPGLLAVYGLYERDLGNDGKAREFLEAAVKAGVVRPKAHLVLAKLRYLEAIDKPLGSEGKISAQQTAAVLEPLRTALEYLPDADIYRLIVETWVHSEVKPDAGDVAKIIEGVALFPRNIGLAYRSAFVCAQSGHTAQAAELIDRGLVFATEESNRSYFEHLRSTLPPGAN